MLAMARDGELDELAQCLSDAGIQFGTVVGNAVGNPWNLVENRLLVLMTDAVQHSADRAASMLARVAAGNTEAFDPANIGLMVDEAYALMVDAAAADPVASCALPMLNNQIALTKQVAVQAFTEIEAQSRTLMSTVIQPNIDRGAAVLLGAMLQDLQGNAAGPAATPKAPPLRTRPSLPAKPVTVRERQPRVEAREPAPSTVAGARKDVQMSQDAAALRRRVEDIASSASRDKAASRQPAGERPMSKAGSEPVIRKPLRTRSGATFLSEAPQMALSGVQSAAGAVVPDDVQRIALAEFTARTLDPAVLAQVTWQLDALSGRLNGTSGNTVDLDGIERLVNTVRLSNEALYSEIALATIKFYGHEVIDSAGEILVGYAVGTLGGLEAALDNVVGAICSVASLPSGVPCNIVKGIVSFLYQLTVIPSLNVVASAAVHAGWEMTADCGAAAVRGGLDPAAAEGCGTTIASALRWFPPTASHAIAFVAPYLDETQAALREYHAAVLELATAAANAR